MSSTERFFSRLPDDLRFEERSVLDYGCGAGATCFWVAERGARRVVGVDIQDVGLAQRKLGSDYPEWEGRVEFHQLSNGYSLGEEKYDLILSKDTFEHVSDPDAYVAAMSSHLAPGGEIALGFGPLWKSPWGGHIDFMTRLPWAHLLFPEEVIMAERRRFRPEENAGRFEEVLGGLNKMTFARFRDTMSAAGLAPTYFAINATEGARSPLRRAVPAAGRLLARIPGLREYFTFSVYSIWRHA